MLNRILKWLGITKKGLLNIFFGCGLMAFVVVNIHMPSKITEGGVLGFTLFLNKVFNLNPAYVSPILDLICFGFGLSLFGKPFLKKTGVASILFAFFYEVFLRLGPIVPNMYNKPLLAAILAGIGIGLGCGMVISQGGAAGGDDALAMIISKKAKFNISYAYLFTDIVILVLSLVYIPFSRIIFSLVTTTVSSLIVGQFEVKLPKAKVQIPTPEIKIQKENYTY